MTAEEKIITKSGGKMTVKWTPKSSHAANHYLDAECMAACAADIRNVRALNLEEPQEKTSISDLSPATEKTQKETWIHKNEHWI